MREISREPRPGQFLSKALREAAGELVEELERISERDAWRAPDDDWSFAQIAAHVARSEQMHVEYVESILARRRPKLPVPDLYVTADECQGRQSYRSSIYRYAGQREELVYHLWGLPPEAWERTGEHTYLGTISLLQIARTLHLHDLEHLWQVRNHRERMHM